MSTGDRDAFTELVGRHIAGVRRLLWGLFRGHREDMEDAEQEILLALFRSLGGFRFAAGFRTYLYRFTRNRAIDILRKRGRERRVIDRWGRTRGPEPQVDPEEDVLRAEAAGEAMQLLSRLRPEDRALVIMREIEGLSLRETAQVLGVRVGTVKSRLHRMRTRIGAMMQED